MAKPKSREKDASRPLPRQAPAKVLQHPSAPKTSPKQSSKPPVASSPKGEKREYPDWTTIPGLRKSDFREVLLRRQKYKAQEKVAKRELEGVPKEGIIGLN